MGLKVHNLNESLSGHNSNMLTDLNCQRYVNKIEKYKLNLLVFSYNQCVLIYKIYHS